MGTTAKQLKTRCLSSLTKVFADEELQDTAYNRGSALRNETYSFQVAFYTNGPMIKDIQVHIESEIDAEIQLRTVGLAPSEFPCYVHHDENILRSTPGLYPDPLFPVTEEGLTAFTNQWRSLWVTVDVDTHAPAGLHDIGVSFQAASGETLANEVFQLEVIPAELPEQQLIHTEWFHTDCIADQYQVDVFSEPHWKLVEKYVQTAVKHGMNMLLTPIFTPPLDTEIGGERPTVQLVAVEKEGEHYTFSFEKLKRWIDMCSNIGIRYFEFSHLFSQWGAKHAPKIMATENGEMKQIFGWDTDASGVDYRSFLNQFLPELVRFIHEQGLKDRVYFHVSDEPSIQDIESYKSASEQLHEHLSAFPIMDALSDYDFYQKGLVKNPIPANNHIEAFLENGVPDLWTYYCCAQNVDVSNRFFAFPSARNRVIGMQLYKYDIKGFLHWGYNFWFTQFSKRSLDPFRNTDAGYGFPSGDAFVVYPGEDGPIESIRLKVFYEGLQDQRALQLLESLIGKEEVVALLEKDLDKPITFKAYPEDKLDILQKREEVNRLIAKNIK